MRTILIFFFLSTIFSAQENKNIVSTIYNSFNYQGGNLQFFRDAHEIIVKKKLRPCENKNELYMAKIIVYPDSTIKLVEEEDPGKIEKNKCAYELAKTIIRYSSSYWEPIEIDGEKKETMAGVNIFPDVLFEKYNLNYDALNYYKSAEFPGGIEAFKQKIRKNVNLNGLVWDFNDKLILRFTIDENGNATDFRITSLSFNKEVEQRYLSALSSIKDKWKPAKLHNLNVTSYIGFPISLELI
ncbi:TPA: energy transducer TonB [Elizabethkingia anophelis]|nr:energy transducer TonB [Elizabethkingia anophelis]